jgi:hypothetical protein
MKRFLLLAVSLVGCATPSASSSPSATPSTAAAPAPTAPAPASPAPAPSDAPHVREERANATVDHLAAKDFSGCREWFDGVMRDQLSVEKLRDTWAQVEAASGAYRSRSFDGAMRVQGHPVLEYDLTFEKAHFTARVVFDDAGFVAGLFLVPRS